MPDIICPLLNLPDPEPLYARLQNEGIRICRPASYQRTAVREFILAHFGQGWVDEVASAFNRHPATAFIAVHEKRIVGFSAYEATAPAYFGPTGVDDAYRGRSIGKALLYAALYGLRELGYIYGFIGAPGPIDFYLKATPGLLLPAEWRTFHSTVENLG